MPINLLSKWSKFPICFNVFILLNCMKDIQLLKGWDEQHDCPEQKIRISQTTLIWFPGLLPLLFISVMPSWCNFCWIPPVCSLLSHKLEQLLFDSSSFFLVSFLHLLFSFISFPLLFLLSCSLSSSPALIPSWVEKLFFKALLQPAAQCIKNYNQSQLSSVMYLKYQ